MTLFDSGIRPAVDGWLLDEAAKTRDYGDYWSASSAGYCMRKNIFERLGVPHVKKEDDARRQRVFTAGHLFHAWIQKITEDAGLSIAQELELIDDDLMVKGHFDDLVLVDGKLILYDYKTRNSKNFDYSKNPSHFHKMQLGTYMYMLRKHPDENGWKLVELIEARILNIEKDTLRMTEVQYMWSPELEKEVYQYWSTLNGYWKSKKIPKCTCDKYENGFMARERFNPYFYAGEPCSLDYYNEWKEQNEDTK